MAAEDEQAIGRGTGLASDVVLELVKGQTNDDVLQIEGNGEERRKTTTESGAYEYGVPDGVALLISHVQTSKISEGAVLSFGNSQGTQNGFSKLSLVECSNNDTPSDGVPNCAAIGQLSHREGLQLGEIENLGENAGAFSGEDVKHTNFNTTPSMTSEVGDGICSQDCSSCSGCANQHAGAANQWEGEDCQVVFERKLSFGNRESGPDVDEIIWKSLPEDVEDKVLAWLPLGSCSRFRSVCKRWYNLLNSERFFQMHSSNAGHETWILAFGDQSPDPKLGFKYEGHVFDPITSRTFTLEFPFLPENSDPVASAGGLVCFCCDSSSNGERDVGFYVCNPITKAWKFIPSPCSRVSVVTLVVDSESSFMGYKLYVFCEASAVRWLWVGVLDHSAMEYDSKLNRWKDVGDVHSGEQFKPGSVYMNGKVHLLSSEIVEALDVQQGNWIKVDGAPAYASCATLLQREGRLLVVGDMVHHNVFHLPNLPSYVGVVIWEFDPVTHLWIEVSRLPETMVDSFSYSSFSCVIVGDLLFLFSKNISLPLVMIYSFPQQTWSCQTNTCSLLTPKVFAFSPRLDACP